MPSKMIKQFSVFAPSPAAWHCPGSSDPECVDMIH